MNWKNIGKRLMWTAIQAAGGVLVTVTALDITAVQAAGMAAATAVIALITLIARDALAQLDDSAK